MSVVVELSIRTDRFELGTFIDRHEGLTAEFDRIVPTSERAMPFVWVTGPREELEALTGTLEASDRTTDVTVLDDLPDDGTSDRRYLYRIEWDLSDVDLLDAINSTGGSIMAGRSSEHYWRLRIRFRSHGDVVAFYDYLAEHDVTDFSLDRIQETETEEPEAQPFDELTPEQREALVLAVELGYFGVPGRATLAELGDELGITQQAASQRINRGLETLVSRALNVPPPV